MMLQGRTLSLPSSPKRTIKTASTKLRTMKARVPHTATLARITRVSWLLHPTGLENISRKTMNTARRTALKTVRTAPKMGSASVVVCHRRPNSVLEGMLVNESKNM